MNPGKVALFVSQSAEEGLNLQLNYLILSAIFILRLFFSSIYMYVIMWYVVIVYTL